MVRKTEKPVKKISTGYLTYVNRLNWSFFRPRLVMILRRGILRYEKEKGFLEIEG